MRYALLLVTLWLSVAGGAEPKKQAHQGTGGPWELDWGPNKGDCVVVGALPKNVTCKLYAHGQDGFQMKVYVYENGPAPTTGPQLFFDLAERLCNALGTKVKVEFFAGDLDRAMIVEPPSCKQPVTS